MQQRVEPETPGAPSSHTVVARLKEQRYLDDQSFAETYARLRQENEKLGQRRVAGPATERHPLQPHRKTPSTPATRQTNEEALARQHLERKRIRKPETKRKLRA